MDKQYAERDIMALDRAGNHYCRHLSAMTGEGLHEKSDIAAELAYRDARITELEEREQALAAYVERLSKAVEACMSDDERKFVFTPDDYIELESALEAKFSDSLLSRDEESMRKGFWWGFERARMHPDENNILAQWEDVKALKRRNESVRQERAKQ